jgi:hypothetical protein
MLGSCGSSDNTNDADIKISSQDSAVYRLGRDHARRMLEQCATTDELRQELLDIRARETVIRSRMCPLSGDAYIQGVRHYIKEHGDTLADTLFGQ